MSERVGAIFDEARAALAATRDRLAGRIAEAAALIAAAYEAGGGVLLFGNGGSAADAQHIAAELVGRFRRERRALRAEALTANTSSLTAIANDYDYERVFARQIEAAGRAGDVAIGLSTSGNSANVVAGLERAGELGLKTIAFTGPGGGRCAAVADVLLDVPADETARVQECHVVAYHALCELVEERIVAGGPG